MTDLNYLAPVYGYCDDGTSKTFFPPEKDDNTNVEEIIPNSVYRCFHFSSKLVNRCELTNKYYKDEEAEKLVSSKLKGAEQLSNRHCSGVIVYHPDNEKYLDFANMYFECQENIIQKHSWCEKNINIQRTNGDILATKIMEDSCVRLRNGKIMFYVKFIINEEAYFKWVPLTDYYSESTNTEISGLITLNPNILDDEIILQIDKHPEWMNEERTEWKDKFNDAFNNSGIKYKFSYD